MLKLAMVSLRYGEIPSIRFKHLYYLSYFVTFHLTGLFCCKGSIISINFQIYMTNMLFMTAYGYYFNCVIAS